jgi:hypothetical protein
VCAAFGAKLPRHGTFKIAADKLFGRPFSVTADRKQARTIFRYVRGLLTRVPMLARMVEHDTADCFDLTNDVSIEIGTASFRSARGYTLVAALCDEIAFWQTDDSANPDYEILDALRPGMATIPMRLASVFEPTWDTRLAVLRGACA